MANYRKHHIGDKFGRLTLTKVLSADMWLCKCDCGNEVIGDATPIRAGRKKSCGCARRRNYPGEVIGALTILKYEGGGWWLCKCECGNEKLAKAGALNEGAITSCGCHIHQFRLREAKKKQTHEERKARQRARYYERKNEIESRVKKVVPEPPPATPFELQALFFSKPS